MTESIKIERVSKEPIRTQTICKICNGKLKDASFIERCQHVFCLLCIKKHTADSNKCPVCDKEFTFYLSNISSNLKCQIFYVKKRPITTENEENEKKESCSCNCQNSQQNGDCNHKFCRLCFKTSFFKLKECLVCRKRLEKLIAKRNSKKNKTTLTSQSNENVVQNQQLSSQSAVLKDVSSLHKSKEKHPNGQIESTQKSNNRIEQTANRNNELGFSISNTTAVLNQNTIVCSESTNFNLKMITKDKQSNIPVQQMLKANVKLDEQIRNFETCNKPSSSTDNETPGQSHVIFSNASEKIKIEKQSNVPDQEMVNKDINVDEQAISSSTIIQSSSIGVQKDLDVGFIIEPQKIESEKKKLDARIWQRLLKSTELDNQASSKNDDPTFTIVHEIPQESENFKFCESLKIKSEEKPKWQMLSKSIETNEQNGNDKEIEPSLSTLSVLPNRVKNGDLPTNVPKIKSESKHYNVSVDRMANESTQTDEKGVNGSSYEPISSASNEKSNYSKNDESHHTFWEGREFKGKSKRRQNRIFFRGNHGLGRHNSRSEGCSCGGYGCKFCRPFRPRETRYHGNRPHYDFAERQGRSRHQNNNIERGNFCIRGSYSVRRRSPYSTSSKIHVDATYSGNCPMSEVLQLMEGHDKIQNSFKRMSNSDFQDYNLPFDNYRNQEYHPHRGERKSRSNYRPAWHPERDYHHPREPYFDRF